VNIISSDPNCGIFSIRFFLQFVLEILVVFYCFLVSEILGFYSFLASNGAFNVYNQGLFCRKLY